MRNLDGLPMQVKPGLVDTMNRAFKVFGLVNPVKGTAKSLTIGGTNIQVPRGYDTSKSIQFDNKVGQAVREVLNFDLKAHDQKIDEINAHLESISPRYHLGSMGHYVNMADIERFLAQAKAVEEYVSQDWVKEALVQNDALKVLFSRHYAEIIKGE